jgi:hypothetical protein
VIRGNLDRLHLGDLLQWVQMGGLSGRLALVVARQARYLDFLDGRVVYASSGVASERLANWLAQEGLPVTRLRQLLGVSLLRRTLFTDELIEAGMAPESLAASLTRLAEAITTRVLLADEVDFAFDPTYPVLDLLSLNIDVEPNALLLEAARRTDENLLDRESPPIEELPFTGEAFDSFFWELLREGVPGDETLDGEQVVDIYGLIRSITATLSQWLASSPGLVPIPPGQSATVAEQLGDGGRVRLSGQAQACWNQMVLACSVHTPTSPPPRTMDGLEAHATELDLWMELIGSERWHRPHAGQLDELTATTVERWADAAAAAAAHIGVEPEAARLAAHLLAVPSDLVLWVLTTLPVPHRTLRRTLVRRLPERLGAALAARADFPAELRDLWTCRSATPLGACLHLARDVLPTPEVWPETVPDDEGLLHGVASAESMTAAAAAARAAVADAVESVPVE